MASRSLGTLTLDLVAKIGGFEQGMDKAARKSKQSMDSIEKNVNKAAKSLAALGVAGVAGLAAMTVSLANSGREIENLSRVANSSTEEFQRIAYAARLYGVEQDKVADILKDTNDKVGDFLTTGAGPLADFFETVAPAIGVTADEFRNLSGPQALQLYVDSLEKANLSQAEMTFFMEAIASDATLLLPLLKNNGRELGILGDQAERTGNVLSDIDLQQLQGMTRDIDELKSTFTGFSNEVTLAAIPAVRELTGLLNDPATLDAARMLGEAIVKSVTAATEAISGAINVTKFLAEELAAMTSGIASGDIVRLEREADRIRAMLEDDSLIGMGNRLRFFGPDGLVEFYSKSELQAELDKITSEIESYYDGQGVRPRIVPEIAGADGSAPAVDIEAARARIAQANEQANAQKELNRLFDAQLATYEQQIALTGEVTELERIRYDIASGKLVGINDEQQARLEGLAAEIDAIEALADIEARVAAVRKGAMTDEQQRMATLQDQYRELAELVQAGGLSQEEGATLAGAYLVQWEEAEEAAKNATNEMSSYADQAARNMQSAFAEFLFDPFDEGLDGLLNSFIRTFQKMAAEAAAAQIFDSIGQMAGASKNSSGGTDWGSLIASFAGAFDSGGTIGAGQWGIVGERGPELVQGPAMVTSRQATAAALGGSRIQVGQMVFPNVRTEREAQEATGAAARQLSRIAGAGQRYS